MHLYIVESPLQLLNAIEAKKAFPSQKHILVVKYSKEKKNNDQIDSLLKNSSWDRIYTIPFLFSTKMQIIFFCLLTKRLVLKRYSFQKIFIGEFRSDEMWMMLNTLPHDEAFLLDDGNMTIEVQKRYLKDLKAFNSQRKKKKKDILFQYFQLKNADRRMIHLYTMFELEPYTHQKIITNRFPVLASRMESVKNISDSSHVFFIGANLVELGIVTEEYFFDCMEYIYDYYRKKQKKFIYLPHRREENAKLIKMRKLFGLEIQNPDYILELYFYYNQLYPEHIASFYSTALYSLKKIYNSSSVHAFKLNPNRVQERYRSEIETTYDFYSQHMQIIELK